MTRTFLILGLLLPIFACGDKDAGEDSNTNDGTDSADPEGDADADSDADSDTDADADSDSDSDADSDTDSDSDADPSGEALIDFDDPNVTYTLTGFGGAEDSSVVADPTDSTNKVAKVNKASTAELWAGTTFSTGDNFSIPTLPITADDTEFTLRVWSPRAGIEVRLKVEDASDPTRSVETVAYPTSAETWETLNFDFANEASGTAELNTSYNFNKVSVFFDFGKTGADGGGGTFYFDDFDSNF
ncbi:hypothetical protein L6R49_07445 [Myxococcota bacterium]|nr:hypothetical protein [Myxococcota bacterium]